MKVKCIKLLDEQTRESLDSSSWLTVGKIYHVLSINMQYGFPVKFQLVSDDNETPAYHDANQFEVVTRTIPAGWLIDFESESYFKLVPKSWSRQGFWEDYFDGMPEAVELFNTEKENIMQADP